MKLFLVEVAIAMLVVTIIMAVVFRSRRAWDVLHFIRRAGWIYAAVIVLAALLRLWQG